MEVLVFKGDDTYSLVGQLERYFKVNSMRGKES